LLQHSFLVWSWMQLRSEMYKKNLIWILAPFCSNVSGGGNCEEISTKQSQFIILRMHIWQKIDNFCGKKAPNLIGGQNSNKSRKSENLKITTSYATIFALSDNKLTILRWSEFKLISSIRSRDNILNIQICRTLEHIDLWQKNF
jgi:hypothetical protein